MSQNINARSRMKLNATNTVRTEKRKSARSLLRRFLFQLKGNDNSNNGGTSGGYKDSTTGAYGGSMYGTTPSIASGSSDYGSDSYGDNSGQKCYPTYGECPDDDIDIEELTDACRNPSADSIDCLPTIGLM